MANIIKNLWFEKGNISLPGKTVPCWAYSLNGGIPQVPGPIIEAETGDNIIVVLLNSFLNNSPVEEPASIIFPGQSNVMVSEWPGIIFEPVQPQYDNGRLKSLSNFIEPGSFYFLDALIYRFEAVRPGIFLYESGINPEKQIQMGAYGVLIIRPEGFDNSEHQNYKTAYGTGTNSNYDVEKVLVLGEFDSQMHENINPGEYYNMLDFNPDYWVINGRSYPDTVNNDYSSSQPYGSRIECNPGDKVLLRLLNAGFNTHTLSLGEFQGRIIAENSFPLVNNESDISYERNSITLAAGQSIDLIITPVEKGEYFLYAREYNHLINSEQFPGGMMTKIEVL